MSDPGATTPAVADVVVVGGGLAGYCAAVEAADRGARVVLLEREPRIGGATVLSGGSFAFAGTPLQARHGIEDSRELLFDDLRRVGDYKNDESLVRTYVDQQLAAYRWLGELGIVFDKVFIASGQSVPRAHSRNPTEVLDAVARAAGARGVATCLSTSARRLRRDPANGRVSGIDVASPQGAAHIRAERGVVLATGGFSRNERLLQLFAPGQAAAQRM